MNGKKNTRPAEIAIIIILIIFIILVSITYKNLSILAEGMSNLPAEELTETTTELQ